MKSLYETFTDKEFGDLKRAKKKWKNGNRISWRMFLLQVARMINKENGKRKKKDGT